MRIMITGANGFIGKYLSSYLQEVGHQIFACSRDKLDMLDANAVRQFFNTTYFDLVINCALVGRDNINDPMQSIQDPLIRDNLRIWDNLVNNRHRFKRLINFGSGHEFDIDRDINYAQELDIFNCEPTFSYGYVKNFISRDAIQYENFYTLRLFGVFHYSENTKRFFKKLWTKPKQDFIIENDRYFDFINLEDIAPMVELIGAGQVKDRDINLVYNEKLLLSDLAKQFNEIKILESNIIVNNISNNSYTGDFTKFYQYNTPKLGMHLGWLRY